MSASDGSSFLPFYSHRVRDGDGNTQQGEETPSLITAPYNKPKLCAAFCYWHVFFCHVQVEESTVGWTDLVQASVFARFTFQKNRKDILKVIFWLWGPAFPDCISFDLCCLAQLNLHVCQASTNYWEKGKKNKCDIYIHHQQCFLQPKVISAQ